MSNLHVPVTLRTRHIVAVICDHRVNAAPRSHSAAHELSATFSPLFIASFIGHRGGMAVAFT